jgi:hypothetical protein
MLTSTVTYSELCRIWFRLTSRILLRKPLGSSALCMGWMRLTPNGGRALQATVRLNVHQVLVEVDAACRGLQAVRAWMKLTPTVGSRRPLCSLQALNKWTQRSGSPHSRASTAGQSPDESPGDVHGKPLAQSQYHTARKGRDGPGRASITFFKLRMSRRRGPARRVRETPHRVKFICGQLRSYQVPTMFTCKATEVTPGPDDVHL